MKDNRFFNPSPLYKEFMLLDVIEKNESITQRDMSSLIHASVSMINEYLAKYEEKKYLHRIYQSSKKVKYQITDLGIQRKKLLNVWYLSASQNVYIEARKNLTDFFKAIVDSQTHLLLYGAGEMSEIIIDMIEMTFSKEIQIVAIIDDAKDKQQKAYKGYEVISPDSIIKFEYDFVFIASYNHSETMIEKLAQLKIDRNKILDFFRGPLK